MARKRLPKRLLRPHYRTPFGYHRSRIALGKSGTSFPAPPPSKRHLELLANTCGG